MTPAQHRKGLRLAKLPPGFVVPAGRLPLSAGRVIFIRRVSPAGAVTVLSQSFRVGKRHKGLYLRLVVDTGATTDSIPEWARSEALALQVVERLTDTH